MDADLRLDSYVGCLSRIYAVVLPWEIWAASHSPEWIREMVAARQRSHMLEQDLAWFGVQEPQAVGATLPSLEGEASLMGAMYVMEGSTLGGQLIARHVENVLGFSRGQGNSYFRGHQERTGLLWKEFCDALKAKIPEGETDAAIASAKAMFAVFGEWMQRASPLQGVAYERISS